MSATYPIQTIAALLELSSRRVRQLADEGVIPRPTERGRYELVPAVRGYIRFLRDRAINADASEGSAGDHKTRLIKARADIAEMEAERMAGELVAINTVAETWGRAASHVRAKLLAIPYKTAPLVAVEEDVPGCYRILEAAIHEALVELSETPVYSEDEVAPADDEAPESPEEVVDQVALDGDDGFPNREAIPDAAE